MTVRLRDLLLGLRNLHLADAPVIVHSSLKSFGQVEGGAGTVVNALARCFRHGDRSHVYLQDDDLPADRPGKQRHHLWLPTGPEPDGRVLYTENARRPVDGYHPGDASQTPARQTFQPPHPIFCRHQRREYPRRTDDDRSLLPRSVCWKKRMAGCCCWAWTTPSTPASITPKNWPGASNFIRWALTPKGVVECPGFPGCSAGFQAIAAGYGKVHPAGADWGRTRQGGTAQNAVQGGGGPNKEGPAGVVMPAGRLRAV